MKMTNTLEAALQQNTKLNKIAKITRRGPRTTKLIIKDIPISTSEVLASSIKHQNGQDATMVKYYPYKKSNAFSQVIMTAAKVLMQQQPKTKIGPSYFMTQLLIPTICASPCSNTTYFAKCGYERHSSGDCTVKDTDTIYHTTPV